MFTEYTTGEEQLGYVVLHLDLTMLLLILLAFLSGVTSMYSYWKRKEVGRLRMEVEVLETKLRRYMRLVEELRRESEEEKRNFNIDLKILELYGKGYSLRKIAKEVGLSHTTVARRLKKLLETRETPESRVREALAT